MKICKFTALILDIIYLISYSIFPFGISGYKLINSSNLQMTSMSYNDECLSEVEYESNSTMINPSLLETSGSKITTNISDDSNSEVAYTSIYDAGAALRAEMKNRISPITIVFKTSNYTKELSAKIWDEAIKYTGNPTEGDYLSKQLESSGCKIDRSEIDGVSECRLEYSITYETSLQQENEIDKKVKQLLDEWNLNTATDYLKCPPMSRQKIKNYNDQG